ncbi:MAG: SDR family NAD(P)-dependent oxidoreductase [Alphaproteobacteria bacterium]|nr:MAG: SDR family NAD(P)-dependent oxidoreductase [Alphaproteobacteria bacterium]
MSSSPPRPRNARAPQSILITGASSGIGAALAILYAEPTVVLHLTGRDRSRLAAVAEQCRARGATVALAAHDIRDQEAIAAWIAAVDADAPLDLVIANAAIGGGATLQAEADQASPEARAIFEVNLLGLLNTVQPILPRLIARGRGQIALVSSLSAWRGLPDAPAYSAAKAAVKIYGEALRGQLAPMGVRVSVVLPGVVTTPMSASLPVRMPFAVSAERAAEIIRSGLARNRGRIAFSRPLAMMFWGLALLPPSWSDWIVAKLRLHTLPRGQS